MPKTYPKKAGEGTNIHQNCLFTGDVRVGKYCAIARNCVFHAKDHNMTHAAIQDEINHRITYNVPEKTEQTIKIENDVWIGNKAKILKGVTVGNGAIIGMGSVVTKDVKPYEIVAGNPAKHIGWRFNERKRQQLQDIEWWNWSKNKMKENKEFFTTDLEEYDGNLKELVK